MITPSVARMITTTGAMPSTQLADDPQREAARSVAAAAGRARVQVAADQRVDDVEPGEQQAGDHRRRRRGRSTGTPTIGPITISMTEGGIRMPSVPPAVITPADIGTS